MPLISKMFTATIDTLRATARLFGLRLAVKLPESPGSKIELEMIDPDTPALAWDESQYLYGNVFVGDAAQPVTVDPEGHATRSEKYEAFMEQHLIDDLLTGGNQSKVLLVLSLIIIALQFGIIALLVMGVL